MRQILLLVLLFVVGQWFVKALRRAQTQTRAGAQPEQGAARNANGGASASGKAALPEPMVRCAECGVHAPRSESVNVGARSFCSSEHARAWDARTTAQDRPAR
ncbi:PP0621 family protein [Paraburkholderia sp. CNPSo 3076]|uniref:PP0621 family protein n=1 Tax=Paraburkholderia sp. CNPSo 3076 TaxID=2940936 RepID=UPI0022550F03|nr:PP0621 family protein [Paraburkholderia sp. CNPSo 3076]MCX5544563.1 PP0621 family protein [Paraburkholderia sp. CNPSo 3076]